jgi:hypothetical protein
VRRNLTATAAVTCAAVLIVLLGPAAGGTGAAATALRTIAGLPLVLMLPGYALSLLLLPSVPDRAWRLAWSVGLSLAVAVLAGLLLNFIPAGLTTVTWTAGLAAVTLAALTAVALLPAAAAPPRAVQPVQDTVQPVQDTVQPAHNTGPSVRDTGRPWAWPAMLGPALAVALVAGAIALTVVSAPWPRPPGFAELRLVPAPGPTASVDVRNAYPKAETFLLTVQNGNSAPMKWTITLGPGQEWKRIVPAVTGKPVSARLTTPGPALTARLAP